MAPVVKNLPANAGDIRDVGLIPGLGRFSGAEHSNLLDILAWRIPWTQEPGWQQSMGSQGIGQDLSLQLAKRSLQVTGSVQFSSVAQSCPTLCDLMNRSMAGLAVHHQLPEFTQTHVH